LAAERADVAVAAADRVDPVVRAALADLGVGLAVADAAVAAQVDAAADEAPAELRAPTDADSSATV
jgi:hypothetical protein